MLDSSIPREERRELRRDQQDFERAQNRLLDELEAAPQGESSGPNGDSEAEIEARERLRTLRATYWSDHTTYIDSDGTLFQADFDASTQDVELERRVYGTGSPNGESTYTDLLATLRDDGTRENRIDVVQSNPHDARGVTTTQSAIQVLDRDGALIEVGEGTTRSRVRPDGTTRTVNQLERFRADGTRIGQTRTDTVEAVDGTSTIERTDQTFARDGQTLTSTNSSTTAIDTAGEITAVDGTLVMFWPDGVTPRSQTVSHSADGEVGTSTVTDFNEAGVPLSTGIIRNDDGLPEDQQDAPGFISHELISWTPEGDIEARLIGGSDTTLAQLNTQLAAGRRGEAFAEFADADTLDAGAVMWVDPDSDMQLDQRQAQEYRRGTEDEGENNRFDGTAQGWTIHPALEPGVDVPAGFMIPAEFGTRATAARLDELLQPGTPAFDELAAEQFAYTIEAQEATTDQQRLRLMESYFSEHDLWIEQAGGPAPALFAAELVEGSGAGMFGEERAEDLHVALARTHAPGSDEQGNPTTVAMLRNLYADGSTDDIVQSEMRAPGGASSSTIESEHHTASGALTEHDIVIHGRQPRATEGLEPIEVTNVTRERFDEQSGLPVGQQYYAMATHDSTNTSLSERTETYSSDGIHIRTVVEDTDRSRAWDDAAIEEFADANASVLDLAHDDNFDVNNDGTTITTPPIGVHNTHSITTTEYGDTGEPVFSQTIEDTASVAAPLDVDTQDTDETEDDLVSSDANGARLTQTHTVTTTGEENGSTPIENENGQRIAPKDVVSTTTTSEFDPDDGSAGGNNGTGFQRREITEITTGFRVQPGGEVTNQWATPMETRLLLEGHDDDWVYERELIETNADGTVQTNDDGEPIKLEDGDEMYDANGELTHVTDARITHESLDNADNFEQFMDDYGSYIVMAGTIAAGIALAVATAGTATPAVVGAIAAVGAGLATTQAARTYVNYRQDEASGWDLALDVAGVVAFIVPGAGAYVGARGVATSTRALALADEAAAAGNLASGAATPSSVLSRTLTQTGRFRQAAQRVGRSIFGETIVNPRPIANATLAQRITRQTGNFAWRAGNAVESAGDGYDLIEMGQGLRNGNYLQAAIGAAGFGATIGAGRAAHLHFSESTDLSFRNFLTPTSRLTPNAGIENATAGAQGAPVAGAETAGSIIAPDPSATINGLGATPGTPASPQTLEAGGETGQPGRVLLNHHGVYREGDLVFKPELGAVEHVGSEVVGAIAGDAFIARTTIEPNGDAAIAVVPGTVDGTRTRADYVDTLERAAIERGVSRSEARPMAEADFDTVMLANYVLANRDADFVLDSETGAFAAIDHEAIVEGQTSTSPVIGTDYWVRRMYDGEVVSSASDGSTVYRVPVSPEVRARLEHVDAARIDSAFEHARANGGAGGESAAAVSPEFQNAVHDRLNFIREHGFFELRIPRSTVAPRSPVAGPGATVHHDGAYIELPPRATATLDGGIIIRGGAQLTDPLGREMTIEIEGVNGENELRVGRTNQDGERNTENVSLSPTLLEHNPELLIGAPVTNPTSGTPDGWVVTAVEQPRTSGDAGGAAQLRLLNAESGRFEFIDAPSLIEANPSLIPRRTDGATVDADDSIRRGGRAEDPQNAELLAANGGQTGHRDHDANSSDASDSDPSQPNSQQGDEQQRDPDSSDAEHGDPDAEESATPAIIEDLDHLASDFVRAFDGAPTSAYWGTEPIRIATLTTNQVDIAMEAVRSAPFRLVDDMNCAARAALGAHRVNVEFGSGVSGVGDELSAAVVTQVMRSGGERLDGRWINHAAVAVEGPDGLVVLDPLIASDPLSIADWRARLGTDLPAYQVDSPMRGADPAGMHERLTASWEAAETTFTPAAIESAAVAISTAGHEAWRLPRRREDGTYEPRLRPTTDAEWVAAHPDLVHMEQGAPMVDIAALEFADLPADRQALHLVDSRSQVGAILRHAKPGEPIDFAVLDAASHDIHVEWQQLHGNEEGLDPNALLPYEDLPMDLVVKNWVTARQAAQNLGIPESPALQSELIRRVRRAYGIEAQDTAAVHRDTSRPEDPWVGPITPERAILHERYFAALREGVTPPASGQPHEVVLWGVAGSGKTTALQQLRSSNLLPDDVATNAVAPDADQAKSYLPEYETLRAVGDPDAGSAVHRESAYMAYAGRRMAEADGLNVIYQQTGKNPGDLGESFDAHLLTGHTTSIVVTDVPLDVAISRAEKRGADTGRNISSDDIRAQVQGLSENVLSAIRSAGVIGSVRIIDMSTFSGADAAPVIATRDQTGHLEVLDSDKLRDIAVRAGVEDADGWLLTTEEALDTWGQRRSGIMIDGNYRSGPRFSDIDLFTKAPTPVRTYRVGPDEPARQVVLDYDESQTVTAPPGTVIASNIPSGSTPESVNDAWVTSGEPIRGWVIQGDLFDETYTGISGETVEHSRPLVAQKRSDIPVGARQMPVDFMVLSEEGVVAGKPGDWMLEGTSRYEAWVNEHEIFTRGYRRHSGTDAAMPSPGAATDGAARGADGAWHPHNDQVISTTIHGGYVFDALDVDSLPRFPQTQLFEKWRKTGSNS